MYFGTRGPPPPKDALFLPSARFNVVLSGSRHLVLPIKGQVTALVLWPGDMQISPHDSWEIMELREPHEQFCIVPRSDFLRISYYRYFRDATGAFSAESYDYHTPQNYGDPLRYTARALTACAHGPHRPEAVQCLALALRHLAAAELQAAARVRHQGHAEATFQKVRRWLEAHVEQPTLSRERAADTFGLSPAYVSRLFQRHAGESFMDYLTRQRLDFAEQLLRDTELKVSEVGAQCGFCSASYFVRRFHQRRGVTPGAYRFGCAPRNPVAEATKREGGASPSP